MTDVSMLNATVSRISEKLDVCVHENSAKVDAIIVIGFFFGILIIVNIVICIFIILKKTGEIPVAPAPIR